LLPGHSALENLMINEVEWFADRSRNLLGAIARGTGAAGWNYAILKRDKSGQFRIRKVMGNFFDAKAARVDLLLQMAEMAKTDHAHRYHVTLDSETPACRT